MDQNEKEKEFQELLEAAEAGDAEAQHDLGQAYEYGEFDTVDLVESMVWYTKAAKQGYNHAQFKLSIFYESGAACEVDFSAAYLWAEKAALQGLTAAQKRVSSFLSLGKGVDRDLQKAAYWEKEFLTKEAGEGNVAALYHLGNFWMQGRPGYPKNSRQAVEFYIQSAQGGYKDAMLKLTGIYASGIETQRDEAAAITWYERAGYADHPATKRLRKVVELRSRCDKSEMEAQYDLGCLLGVSSDEGEAFLQAAAGQGHRDAALLLFEFYSTADSGRSITPEQHKWIMQAAELGVPQAQHFSAMTTNSRQEKLSWLRRAADQGYQPARDEIEIDKLESAPEPAPAAGPDNLIAQLKKRAEAGDEIAKIALSSLHGSPLYSPEKK